MNKYRKYPVKYLKINIDNKKWVDNLKKSNTYRS